MISWQDNTVHECIRLQRWRTSQWRALACVPALATMLACAAGIVLSRGLLRISPASLLIGIGLLSLIITQASFLLITPSLLARANRDRALPQLMLTGLTPDDWLGGHLLAFAVDWLTAVSMHAPLFSMFVWAGYMNTAQAAWACLLVGLAGLNVLLLRLAYWRMEGVHWVAAFTFVAGGWLTAALIYGGGLDVGRVGLASDLARIWAGLCPLMGLLSLHYEAFLEEIPAVAARLSYPARVGPWTMPAGLPLICLLTNGTTAAYLTGVILLGPRRAMLPVESPQRAHGHSGCRRDQSRPCRAVTVRRLFQDNASAVWRRRESEAAWAWTAVWSLAGACFAAWIVTSSLPAAPERSASRLGLWMGGCLAAALIAGPASCFRQRPGGTLPRQNVTRHVLLSVLTGTAITAVAALSAWLACLNAGGLFGPSTGLQDATRLALLVGITGCGSIAVAALASTAAPTPTLARALSVAAIVAWCLAPLWLGTVRLVRATSQPSERVADSVVSSAQLLSISPLWHALAPLPAETIGHVVSTFLPGSLALSDDLSLTLHASSIYVICCGALILTALAVVILRHPRRAAAAKGGEDI